jgi:predicted nucleic acid-binding protein
MGAMPDLPPIFVDTGYFVALLNTRDGLHEDAVALARKWQAKKRSFVTTDAVLVELANFFARSPLRAATIAAIRRLRSASGWTVEPVSSTLLTRSENRYAVHVDKAWSLTDCISMEVMIESGTKEAATPDKHFAQAGFRVLLR